MKTGRKSSAPGRLSSSLVMFNRLKMYPAQRSMHCKKGHKKGHKKKKTKGRSEKGKKEEGRREDEGRKKKGGKERKKAGKKGLIECVLGIPSL